MKWLHTALADQCEVITKGTTPTTLGYEFADRGIGFLRVQNIGNGTIDCRRDLLFVDHATHLALKRSHIQPGDVLLSIAGTIGRSAIVPQGFSDLNCNQAIAIIRAKSSLFQPYLRHWLDGFDAQLQMRGAMVTGTIANLSLTQVGNLQLPLPPLAEQRRIADVLDRAEALRAKRRAALAELDALDESVFRDLIGDPVANSKNWDNSQVLGNMADIVSGVTKGRKLTGCETREIDYLAVANVQDRALTLGTVKRIEATESEIRRYKLQKGDLLLTEGGDPDKLGRGTLWNDELPECIHQNHIFRVRLTDDRLHPLFVSRLVASQRGKRYFLRAAKQTTGIASINMTQLRDFPLLIPPQSIQQEFAKQIAVVEKLKGIHRASLAELDSLFASLQHRAFRGEL